MSVSKPFEFCCKILVLVVFMALWSRSASAFKCPPGFVGDLRNPENCSTFIACTEAGNAIVRPCAADLCFDEEIGDCNYCNFVPICNPLACPPLSEKPFFYFVEYPGLCEKFYFCQEDGLFGGVANCGFGLWFHVKDQRCTIPWAQECTL